MINQVPHLCCYHGGKCCLCDGTPEEAMKRRDEKYAKQALEKLRG